MVVLCSENPTLFLRKPTSLLLDKVYTKNRKPCVASKTSVCTFMLNKKMVMKKRQNINNKIIPHTDITVKEFKEMLFEKFKARPMTTANYRRPYLIIHQTFYDGIDITTNKLFKFCNNVGVKCYKSGYPLADFALYSFLKPNCVIIDLMP